MKKIKKISIFISIFIFMMISTIVYADEINMYRDGVNGQPKTTDGILTTLPQDIEVPKQEQQDSDNLSKDYINPDSFDPSSYSNLDESTVKKYGSKFLGILTTISIIISVITIMLVGLKILVSAPSEKAQYKEHLMPVVIGAIFISSIMAIITTLANFAEKI